MNWTTCRRNNYSEEKQEFLRMQMQQDLGGLTDTVVSRGYGLGRHNEC